MIVATEESAKNSCRSKQGETISYRVEGWGSDRKLTVGYSRPVASYAYGDDVLLTSFKEAKFKKDGNEIDVVFSLNRTTGLDSIKPLQAEVDVPFPLELPVMPKGYALKNVKLNIYTQLDNDKPKLKCSKKLEYCVPAKLSRFERVVDYFGLNKKFCE